jgi:hypothetical protein
VRQAFAQLQSSDAKQKATLQRKHKIATKRAAPPISMLAPRSQFGF